VSPGPLSRAHQFLEKECETCHTPHEGIEAKNCIVCHASAPALARQSTAFHMTIQDCRGCHKEHAPGQSLTSMDHAQLAAIGWRQQQPDRARVVLELNRFLGELKLQKEEAPVAQLDCFSCHANRDPHRGLFGRSCSGCHKDKSWSIAGYRHPSADSPDCAQCHQAPPSHYMEHFEMVSKRVAKQEHARVELCQLCHWTDSWNNIRGVGWHKHH
jgi:hypothetical protein